MSAARRTLERSTMMLLTTSKACLRHPDCHSARENRDTVFAQMRRAMDLIHFVVKEGIISAAKCALPPPGSGPGSASSIVSTASAAAAFAGTGGGPPGSPHHRPTSSSSSSSSLHLPFDMLPGSSTGAHNDTTALLYGELSPSGVHLPSPQGGGQPQSSDQMRPHSRSEYFHPKSIPKYQRRGQLHRAQRSAPGGSFVLAVESTLKWLHEQLDTCPTIINFLRRVQELLDLARMGPLTGPVKEQIAFSLEAALERTQDFTDSAYTSHEHREKILMLADQTKAELGALFRNATTAAMCLVSELFTKH